jgi:hypothetical protein
VSLRQWQNKTDPPADNNYSIFISGLSGLGVAFKPCILEKDSKMKRYFGFSLILQIALIVIITAVVAATQPPEEGGVLPDIVLPVPKSLEHQNYLGLPGSGNFKIPEIKAEVVIIEIFSMY